MLTFSVPKYIIRRAGEVQIYFDQIHLLNMLSDQILDKHDLIFFKTQKKLKSTWKFPYTKTIKKFEILKGNESHLINWGLTSSPFLPMRPGAPFCPLSPKVPVSPGIPGGPGYPLLPRSPFNPSGPLGPGSPTSLAGPGGPGSPFLPGSP